MPRDVGGKLWFLQLSGWPVFLAVVTLALLFAGLATVFLTWASKHSVLQNAVLAVTALATIAALGLVGAALFTR